MQLIDAGMLAFAAWHALKGRVDYPLTHQVPRMVRKLVEEAEDTYALFWNGERLWKRARWPGYRDRPEIWDEAGAQDFRSMLTVLNGLGAVQFRTEGREADELLAAVRHALHDREPLLIRSDDKDFMQLLSGSCWMQGRVRGTVRFRDVREILGVSPAYVADFLALTGDQADGIPRVVTPAKARTLLETRGHLLDWIDRDLQVSETLKQTIEDHRDQLRLNFELVDLSVEAVGSPPPPLPAGDLEEARAVGQELDIGWLGEEMEGYEQLRSLGEAARERLMM